MTVEDRVRFGLRLVLCREPEPTEIQQALTFMQELQQHEGVSSEVALDRLALLALNLKRIYLFGLIRLDIVSGLDQKLVGVEDTEPIWQVMS